jgi:glycosyltransferase involved in cell wall biosynthesis
MDLSEYDGIIFNDVGAAFVAGAVLDRESLSNSVMYTHGSDLDQVLDSTSLIYRLGRVPSYYRRALNHCYRVIAVSRQQAERLKQVSGIAGLTKKTRVIYAGIDRSLFECKPIKNSDSSGINLLSVGRVETSKGFPRKYEIFRSLVAGGLDVHWTVVGVGSYLDELTQNVRRDGLEDRVCCVGAVPRSELPSFYSEADIFWLLSDKESFGLVYLEANACGCPVIARRGSGVEEAVQDGVTGFLVNDVEECRELIENREHERLDPSDLIQHADQFALRRMARKLLSLLRSIDSDSHTPTVRDSI